MEKIAASVLLNLFWFWGKLLWDTIKDWISFWVHLLDHERNGQTGKSMKRASASWVICQFEHCVHDPINAPRMKFNPYIYIL